ncbi:MAG: phage holin family protein [Patescibacteria group bacterium]
MHTILKYLGTVAAVYLTVSIIPGISVAGGWVTILLVALAWSVIMMVVKPVLAILTLPITIITLGLFSFVLNALLFWAMTLVVPGFVVDGFVPALLGALVLSVLSWFIHKIL